MKIILVFVSTLDGKVTKWNDPYVRKWSSKSDKDYFARTWDDSSLIVMGSNTFDADRLKPSEKRIVVIMTRRPSDYKGYEVRGQLEFSDESPAIVTARFDCLGYKEMLLVGGPKLATSFLKERLVDELWLTIEPKIFGTGSNLVSEEKLDIELKLLSCEKVNEQGTLITKYSVINK